jgi:predicted TIM-barrel fold metal-dependent hydrolase
MIIDWQHHASPEEVMKKRGGKPGQPFIKDGKVGLHLYSEVYEMDKQLEFMDKAGIDASVLSATLDSVEDCILTDEMYAGLTKEHPDRFICFAPCIPTRGEEALKELERAITVLGMKGVVISPQNDGAPLDSKKLWPFYDLVSRLDIPIFVHITNIPVGYDALDAEYNLNVLFTREVDNAANTIRLVFGGVILERFERYLHFWGDKIWTELGGKPPFEAPYRENFNELFGKIYFDMAGYEGGMNAVNCALTTISPERMLFGTDYPYNFRDDPRGVKQYIENIRKLELPSQSIEGMLGLNAAKLLGLSV